MMENFILDTDNFCIVEKIDIVRVPVDVIDNRTNTETTLMMLMLKDEYREKIKDICRKYGYSIIQIGEPMKWTIDLNTFEIMG